MSSNSLMSFSSSSLSISSSDKMEYALRREARAFGSKWSKSSVMFPRPLLVPRVSFKLELLSNGFV